MTKPARDISLDIAKAICIILMVIGHSGCPKYLSDFMYLFHMPCFFFISGLLFSEKYFTNLSFGIKKKLKSYYIPFIKWQLLFLLFHNVFASCHIYDNSFALIDFAKRGLRIVSMFGGEQLLGGFWFLISMTWAALIAVAFCYMLSKYNKLTNISISGGVIFLLLVAFLEDYLPFKIPSQFGPQTLLATAVFMTGYMFKRLDILGKMSITHKTLMLSVPLIVAIFTSLSITSSQGIQVVLCYLIALTGIIGVLGISAYLSDKSISKVFTYIGDKTLYILVFHFLAFKIVSYVYIILTGRSIEDLERFPGVVNPPSYLWIIYAIFGIAFSLAVWEIVDKVQKRFAKTQEPKRN